MSRLAQSALRTKVKLKKGDSVKVIAGKDRGKSGKVLQVIAGERKALVEKVNVVKKHLKPTGSSKGGIVEMEKKISLSKVMLVCPQCDKPARIAYRVVDGAKKLRVCKRCNEIIDKG